MTLEREKGNFGEFEKRPLQTNEGVVYGYIQILLSLSRNDFRIMTIEGTSRRKSCSARLDGYDDGCYITSLRSHIYYIYCRCTYLKVQVHIINTIY